ncbi:hypothetical protein NX059_007699 [Plenodomus lindquistii]|nr:hypothetical protein NX059_007699 [Plenodomus lindquistii]
MAEPGRLMGQTTSNTEPEPDELDADGEYEMDDVEYDQAPAEEHLADAEGHTTDAEGSDIDAEGEDVDDEEDEAEPVGAVKIALRRTRSSDDEEVEYEDDDAQGDMLSDAPSRDSDDDSSSAESEEENQWQAEDDGAEEDEVAKSNPNACTYCNQDENDDPSPEFEEYLACVVCGDNAHQQCARDNQTLGPDDDAKQWRCTACIQNDLHASGGAEEEPQQSYTRRRLSSGSKLTKELLPSHRGVDPGGHSIFKELLLPDEPTDGPRSLRKRKNSHDEEPIPLRQTRKKRRSSELSQSVAQPSIAATSPRPPSRSVRAANSAMHDHDSDGKDDAEHSGSDQEEGARLRSSRARRGQPKRSDRRPLAWIEEQQPGSLIIAFHLNNEKVQKIVTAKPKKKTLTVEQARQERRRERDRERRERNRQAAQAARESPEITHYPSIHIQQASPFLGFIDREPDESKSKPYGGVLSEADADTSKTYPSQSDRRRFDEARIKAEEAWSEKQAALYPPEPTRSSKQTATASKIKCVNFGGWEIDTWHAAPYPEEYSKNRVLYICEFCLKYMNSDYVAWRHKLKCPAKHPPGDEIYRDRKYSFFEVDGRKNPVYCQNLCLLAKLFLGSKTLYYDVEPFLFYVMTENDEYGCHFVGYFSKEKRPSSLNNVSCILVLPIHMRNGYGQYLIQFSYLLTRVERKTGSPEKPLSDMGLVSYRKYWRLVLCEDLLEQHGNVSNLSISSISDRTGMTPDDIVSALEGMRALVRDPVTKNYAFRLDIPYFKQYIEKCNAAGNQKINPDCLVWTPYVMGRLGQYEDGPALQTVQQRDEIEEEDKPAPEEGVQIAEATKAQSKGPAKTNGTHDPSPNPPHLATEESPTGDSPAPGTPLANGSTIALAGSHTDDPAIPPSRYEIFPPIPGQPAQRRRPGRPFGSRRRTSTPNRIRNTSLSLHTAPVSKIQLTPSRASKASPSRNGNGNGAVTPGTVSLRRTRSRLGESVTNGDEVEEGGAVKPLVGGGGVNGRSMRSGGGLVGSSRIGIAGKRVGGKGKGKGKGRATTVTVLEEEEEGEGKGEDADGDYDEDDEGPEDGQEEGQEEDAEGDEDEGMDIDAEGEDDDDVVMVGG